jgi:hypothetical protein
MKNSISGIVIIIVLFNVINSFAAMSSEKTEERQYSVVYSTKEFEIRLYPVATLATIQSKAKTYQEISGPGFRKLAGYIFGGNESETTIAMTAPVQMDINDSLSTMSFVMPSKYRQENLPKPNNPEVVIHQTKEEYVAAIRFGGYASDKEIRNYSEKLKQLLTAQGIVFHGNFRFLGYNSPFELLGRRNEIIVSVLWH